MITIRRIVSTDGPRHFLQPHKCWRCSYIGAPCDFILMALTVNFIADERGISPSEVVKEMLSRLHPEVQSTTAENPTEVSCRN
jgi:hypothetical protein